MLINIVQLFPDYKRNSLLHQFRPEGRQQTACTEQDGPPVQFQRFHAPTLGQHIAPLLPSSHKTHNSHFPFGLSAGSKLLFHPLPIAGNNPGRYIHHLLNTSVISAQYHMGNLLLCSGSRSRLYIFLHKPLHNSGICPSKPVDGLVIIPHSKKISSLWVEHFQNLILHRVAVLKLVHQCIRVAAAPILQQTRVPPQFPGSEYQQVIQIQLSALFFLLFESLPDLAVVFPPGFLQLAHSLLHPARIFIKADGRKHAFYVLLAHRIKIFVVFSPPDFYIFQQRVYKFLLFCFSDYTITGIFLGTS